MDELEVQIDIENNKAIIKLSGELTMTNMKVFRTELKAVNLEEKDVILNLEDLEYIDSSGLGIFVKLAQTQHEQEQAFRIDNAQDNVLAIFKLTSLEKYFEEA